MYRTLLALALASGFAFTVSAAEPAPKTGKTFKMDEPIVKVNGTPVPAIYAEFVRQGRVSRNMPPETVSLEALKDTLIAQELLVQDALKNGLDKNPTLANAIEFQRRELLGKAALEDYANKHPIPDAELKAEYDIAKGKAGDSEYRASHILVPTEKEAKDILAQLKKPKASFEALAKKHSKDSSAGNGGDLGWNVAGNLVPEFAQAMAGLQKGELAKAPVKTQFGWHIIKLTDKRALAFPPFEEVKGKIANQLQQHAIRRYVQALRAEAKVE